MPPRSRTALIINAYSHDNFGDAAIMLGTAALLAEMRVRTVVSTRYHEAAKTFYPPRGIEVVDAVLPFPPRGAASSDLGRGLAAFPGLVRLLVLAALTVSGLPKSVRQRVARRWFPVLRMLRPADFVVMAGGGYLYSPRRFGLNLIHEIAQVHLCRWAGFSVLSMPQSVGPITRRFDRWLIRTLRNLPLVLREARSSEGLDLPIVRAPDVALMLTAPAGMRRDSRDVLIVVMDWTWARSGGGVHDLRAYVSTMARLADLLAGAGLSVALGGNSRVTADNQDDFSIAHRVAEAAVTSVPVLVFGDVDEALRAYAASRFLIGTRLHSVLLALLCGTPALAVEYQPKSTGSLAEIGWPHVRDVETFTAEEGLRWVTDSIAQESHLREAALDRCAEARRRLRAAYRHGTG